RKVRDTRAHQGIDHPTKRKLHEDLGMVAAVVVRILLGPYDAEVRDGLAPDEVLLMRFVPSVDRLNGAILAPVVVSGADVIPPRLKGAGEPSEHPEPRLGLGFAGLAEGGLTRLVHGHALWDELLPTQEAVD